MNELASFGPLPSLGDVVFAIIAIFASTWRMQTGFTNAGYVGLRQPRLFMFACVVWLGFALAVAWYAPQIIWPNEFMIIRLVSLALSIISPYLFYSFGPSASMYKPKRKLPYD